MALPEFMLCIGSAILFGFLIGLERQLTGHVAGIRTNILVSMGACLFSLFSLLMDAPDITRIAAQVVTGIGFLCGGVIFKEGINVRGLNTAATIWCAAAIGVLCSSGLLLYATVATAILIASNAISRVIAEKIHPLAHFEEEEHSYVLSISCREENEFAIRATIMNKLPSGRVHLLNLQSADELGGKVEIEAMIRVSGKHKNEHVETFMEKIALEKGVTKVGWELL